MKNTARFTGPLVAILGAIGVVAAPITNADSTDDAYLQGLKAAQITWPDGGDGSMVHIGQGICKDFANGMTFEQALADVKSVAPQLADASIGKIMGVAVGNYCPQYQSKFN
jgi:hypothetical protein